MQYHTKQESIREAFQMVKEEYKELDIEVIAFENCDIITNSYPEGPIN